MQLAGNVYRVILNLFLLLGGVGFLCVFIAYVGALFHLNWLADPLMQPLVPGLFAVWLPTVLLASRMVRFGKNRDFWKIVLSGCPSWMQRGLYGVMAFGVLSFFYFVVLNNQRTKSEALFAGGHLMIFYGVAFCVMYSALHAPALLSTRKCLVGHLVSPLDTFCPTCGRELPPA